MVFVQEVQENTIVFSNRAAETFLGMTQEEMAGKQAKDILPPDMAAFLTGDGDRE